MTDLIVPVARIVDVVTVYEDQIPMDMQGQLSGSLRGMRQVQDWAHAVGRDRKPKQPLMLYGPTGQTKILVEGYSDTEAAEMEDLALEAIAKQEEQAKKTGHGFDFAEAREKRGLPPKERFDQDFRDALNRRVDYMKKNGRTDPQAREYVPYWKGQF